MTSIARETGLRVTATRLPLVEAGPGGMLPPLPKTAWLEIDLDAVVSNVRLLRSTLPPNVEVEPVVKADAYGHGAVAVARALIADGSLSLSVATFDEALELRQAGVEVPILILFPIPAELAPDALRNRLSITAGDRDLLGRTLAALEAAPAGDGRERLPVHLEVETGLGRGGVQPEEVAAVAAAIEACPRARLAGLWSHLQSGGEAGITARQEARFGVAAGLLEAAGVTLPMRHFAASGALLAATAGSYHRVRAGIAIYGMAPDGLIAARENEAVVAALRPAMALRARPVRVAWLEAGTGVSYGPSFVTQRRSCIATLPLGYADGYPRGLSNTAQVLVRGLRAPQVGTVAMDAIMVDVTDIAGPPVTIDDEFTLLGEQGGDRISAPEVARWGNTISHEVVAAMSGRLPRVYYAAAEAVGMRAVACDVSRGPGSRHDRRP
ncbi:MAG: alanine racemase [Candidatus Limnocylindrales bacterium]|jgi:alanine racemase